MVLHGHSVSGRPESDGQVHIAFCVDARNLPHVAVVITSIVDHLSPGAPLAFHILFDGEPWETALFPRGRWQPHSVDFIHRRAGFRDLTQHDHVTPAALLRLDLPVLLDRLDRAVYLDADVILQDDIRKLAAWDLGPYPLAGAIDMGFYAQHRQELAIGVNKRECFIRDVLEFDPGDYQYFNSGVLVLDLKRLREVGFTSRAHAVVAAKGPQLIWRDQDSINVAMRGQIGVLDPKWNAMQWFLYRATGRFHVSSEHAAIMARQIAAPSLLHFTATHKPWDYPDSTPTAPIWWKYALRTSPRWHSHRFRTAAGPQGNLWGATHKAIRTALLSWRPARRATHAILRLFGRGNSFR